MRIIGKLAIVLVLTLIILVGGILGYFYLFLPKVEPASNMKISSTPETVERGRYLANHVVVCMDCHSERDWTKLAGPPIPGTEGKGGELFDERVGFPGSFPAKNITPYHLGDWTDGEIYRTITVGVNKEEDPLFPVMPYPEYANMDPSDVKAIIAYLRTLKPIRNEVPASRANFPMNLIMRTIPGQKAPGIRPAVSDTVKYGKYLVSIAGCKFCHSPVNKGQPIPGQEFSGNQEFILIDGSVVRSANITPDKNTGIGNWSLNLFIERFKMYNKTEIYSKKISPGEFNTIMPWPFYAGMTEEDLTAIYKYLRSLKPIEHRVEKFTRKK